MADAGQEKKVRVDKWLWAARFFKTRSLASRAVNGGLVHVNGERARPSRFLKPGDELRITRGNDEYIVVVVALHDKRGPAKVAVTLYEETPASIEAREKVREERRLIAATQVKDPVKRPGKRDRRLIRRFIRGHDE
ncbi:MAG: S4 domain-containing protein [Thermodesulfobacteriota bacterium]